MDTINLGPAPTRERKPAREVELWEVFLMSSKTDASAGNHTNLN